MNKEIQDKEKWDEFDIQVRAYKLADLTIEIWPYFKN